MLRSVCCAMLRMPCCRKHSVQYDDGEEELVDLVAEAVEFEGPAPPPTLPPLVSERALPAAR